MIETYKVAGGGAENERIGHNDQSSDSAMLILAERERLLSEDAEFAKQHRRQDELNEVGALLAEIQAEYKDRSVATATQKETTEEGLANNTEGDMRLRGLDTDAEKAIIEARELYH